MKRIKGYLIMLIAAFVLPTVVNADGTLQERINNAQNGDTIKLEENFEGSYLLISNKKITLDLNNYNIKTTNNAAIYISGGEVTIKGNGKIESTQNAGISAYNEAVVKVENVSIKAGFHGISLGNTSNLTSATATMDNVTINAQEFGVAVFVDSVFTMNSGKITTVDNCGVGGNGMASYVKENGITVTINGGEITGNIETAGYASCGMYLPQKSKTTINGGTITSVTGPGIVMRGGELVVNGGTINAEGSATFAGWVGDKKNTLSASGIIMDQTTIGGYTDAPNMKVTVSGNAKINGVVETIECLPGLAGDTCDITLKSGVYNSEPDADTIEEGYNVYQIMNATEEQYIVTKEEDITNEVSSTILTKEEVDEDDMELFKQANKNNYVAIGYYDIAVTKNVGDYVIGVVNEPTNKVNVTLDIPNGIEKVAAGFVRKYVIIRIHNGKTDIITDVKDNGNGTITFASDKFSTYMLGYEDVKQETTNTLTPPNTIDNISNYIVLGIIAMFGTLFGYKYIRKIKNS